MSMIFILVLLSAIPFGTSTCPEYTGLRFGQTIEDFIELSSGIMNNSRSRFSLCTWMKRRFTGSAGPIVLHNAGNIMLGDNGFYNYVAGTHLHLTSKYNCTLGTCFHVCMTWSDEDRRIRVYLDGRLIGTAVTGRSELERGREMCLGNSAGVSKSSVHVFGGDMFKLNIYNRVLIEEEIKNMAADICSREEEKLASIKVLSWADILQYRRSGNISDIRIECEISIMRYRLEEIENDLEESINVTQRLEIQQGEINAAILERLNNSEEELTMSRNKTSYIEEKMTEVLGRLQNSEEELTESSKKTNHLEEKLNEVLGKLQKAEQKLEESGVTMQQLKITQGNNSQYRYRCFLIQIRGGGVR